MTKTIIKCISLILLIISTVLCDPPITETPEFGQMLAPTTLDDTDWRGKSYAQLFREDKPDDETAAFGGQKFLSPKKAFMFSFLLPGAGEFYTKSYVKSALFVVLEAGLWTGYSVFHSTGVQRRDDYEDFHDRLHFVEFLSGSYLADDFHVFFTTFSMLYSVNNNI